MVSGLAMEVGNGSRTLFWKDNWVQGIPLKANFPRLFSISNQQGDVIRYCGFWDDLEWIWNFHWRRELFQWEMDLVHHLHDRLRPVRLSMDRDDAIVWKFDKKGVFSTSSVLQVIQSETLTGEITSYSFTSAIWSSVVPSRVELFGWFVLVGRVNTKERLSRLGVIPSTDNACVLCKKEIECVQHLFLLCEVTWQVWCTWLKFFRTDWAVPGTIKWLFESWTGMDTGKQEQRKWLTGFFAVIWNIWWERNDRIFNNKEADVAEIQSRTVLSYQEWTSSDPALQNNKLARCSSNSTRGLCNTATTRLGESGAKTVAVALGLASDGEVRRTDLRRWRREAAAALGWPAGSAAARGEDWRR
ncbi:uncharacterized protein LOC110269371 [Arachis ipaensis]|uniref:uncharacterized protein LOC110269371 n=1 Tax=Arachis ipaensis TaxID=130454 RepID=UPI000A2B1BE5|nr:uncharacterized protein LOC110269371 [Arachis ipaensis]XP_025637207.1 uncharacterized protein LOC112732676 [Arachis hypogaea]